MKVLPEKYSVEELSRTVSKLKNDMAALKHANDELRAEKKILDDILDQLPGTFYIWDDRPRLIRWNKQHEIVTGYSSEDYPNMLPTDFFNKNEHRAIEEALERVFNQGEVTIEATLVTKGGEEIPHVYTAVRTMMGDRPVLMGFGIDISKRKKAENQLQEALSTLEKLKKQIEADRSYLLEEIKLSHDHENIIGDSDLMKYVLFRTEQIAPTDTTVLILGETGTGKELIARTIHNHSMRKSRPLIKVDCAALPANLIESELFGHEKGAFTSAVEKRVGRFELADGATLFLDEIGELPLELQSKLLRVLQNGEFERVGSSRTRRSNVRIIAATNRNLEDDIRTNKFRMDLWYRLSVFTITMPPLRERGRDIILLANQMTHHFARKHGKQIASIAAETIAKLKAHHWPGNIRELENVIERAVLCTRGDALQLDDVVATRNQGAMVAVEPPMKSLAEFEKEHILLALRKTQWQIHGKNGAAALLDINPSTLRGRMRKHGIRKPPLAE